MKDFRDTNHVVWRHLVSKWRHEIATNGYSVIGCHHPSGWFHLACANGLPGNPAVQSTAAGERLEPNPALPVLDGISLNLSLLHSVLQDEQRISMIDRKRSINPNLVEMF